MGRSLKRGALTESQVRNLELSGYLTRYGVRRLTGKNSVRYTSRKKRKKEKKGIQLLGYMRV